MAGRRGINHPRPERETGAHHALQSCESSGPRRQRGVEVLPQFAHGPWGAAAAAVASGRAVAEIGGIAGAEARARERAVERAVQCADQGCVLIPGGAV